MARRILTSAAIVALALTCMWMWPRTELELPELARAQVIAIDHDEDRKPTAPLAVAEAGSPHPQSVIDLRARILARAHRDAASARDRPSTSVPTPRATDRDRSALARTAAPRGPARAAADPDDDAPAIEGLQDRTGRMGPIVEQLNRDFLPLADECFTDARERDPSLAGMLAIEVSVVADAELGTIIEDVEVAAGNEVHDAELLECVRETSLSTILPSPGEDGLGNFVLTMPVTP